MLDKQINSSTKLEYPEFETCDQENNIITLKRKNWEHILERRGNSWRNYWKNIKETVENCDYKKKTKGNKPLTVYIQEKNNNRLKFLQKYLIVIVNINNDVITSYFMKSIEKFSE